MGNTAGDNHETGSKAGYTDTGQQTTKIKQETLRQKINRASLKQ